MSEIFPLKINDEAELRPLTLDDAEAVFALVEANRADFDHWMRWTGRIKSADDARKIITRFADKWAAGDGFHAGIWLNGVLVGGFVCHSINHESKKTEIGYWLSAEVVGRGLVTGAARAVLAYLFEVEKLHRVEIQCAVDNIRSRAVAEWLGFTLEGTLRESEWLTTRFADHALYSLLDREWQAARAAQS